MLKDPDMIKMRENAGVIVETQKKDKISWVKTIKKILLLKKTHLKAEDIKRVIFRLTHVMTF